MVRKKWLIVANGLLWMAAGMNIGNIGIKSIMVASVYTSICYFCQYVYQNHLQEYQ